MQIVSMLADDKPRLSGTAKYEECKVCSEEDMPKAGSMKPFKIGKIGTVLIVRTSKGKISAMPDKCT
jgi:nitrite reductase/ring-hydroxylating ferredoxin subunit